MSWVISFNIKIKKSEFLNNFNINGTDKIRLRSKLHHLRVMNEYSTDVHRTSNSSNGNNGHRNSKNKKQSYYTDDGFAPNGNLNGNVIGNGKDKNYNNGNNLLSTPNQRRTMRGSFNSYLNQNNGNNGHHQPRSYKYRDNKSFSGKSHPSKKRKSLQDNHNGNETLMVQPKLIHNKSLYIMIMFFSPFFFFLLHNKFK